MSHTAPVTYLFWSLMSSLLGIFFVFHLWKSDNFKCLRFDSKSTIGTFKRLMTCIFLLRILGVIAYSLGFAIIKYNEGFRVIPTVGTVPTPWKLWSKAHQRAILPLHLIFSISWSLEMVTHMKELCFWLFIMNAGSVQQDWFRGLYYRTWIIGSLIAVCYMPLVAIFTQADPIKGECYIFLAGSMGSLSLTLWYMPILWTFPTFINNLHRRGININTIIRLTTFHEMNCLRVAFRFLFVAPLLVLAVDGVSSRQRLNDNIFWTEFLACVSAIGCTISYAIALVIFFPRSVEDEIHSRNATRGRSLPRYSWITSPSLFIDPTFSPSPQEHLSSCEYQTHDYRNMNTVAMDPRVTPVEDSNGLNPPIMVTHPPRVFVPNRRGESGVVLEGYFLPAERTASLTESALMTHNRSGTGAVHPFLHNFTSPLDYAEGGSSATARSGTSTTIAASARCVFNEPATGSECGV